MAVIEILMLVILLIICAVTVKTDISEGMIYNRHLMYAFVTGIIFAVIYYGFIAKDLVVYFIINLVIVAAIGLVLFYSHSFAGGDCKLCIVLSLLYPAHFYIGYPDHAYTLFIAVCIAVFYGFIYLIIDAVVNLLNKKNQLTRKYITDSLFNFLKAFAAAMIFLSALNLIYAFLQLRGIYIDSRIMLLVSIFIAWMIGRFQLAKNWKLCLIVLIFDVVVSVVLCVIPISLNPDNYVLAIILMLCQTMTRTNMYEEVEITDLKKGMILAMGSSLRMQGSRVRGLPGLSSEDLSSRLTDAEVESIKRWGEGNKITNILVVKKIPFAIFLTLGFISYFIIWGVLS